MKGQSNAGVSCPELGIRRHWLMMFYVGAGLFSAKISPPRRDSGFSSLLGEVCFIGGPPVRNPGQAF